jgi:hypothetical protein
MEKRGSEWVLRFEKKGLQTGSGFSKIEAKSLRETGGINGQAEKMGLLGLTRNLLEQIPCFVCCRAQRSNAQDAVLSSEIL